MKNELSAICPVKLNIKNVIQVAAGEMHSVCVRNKQLTEERNVFVWGDNTFGQIPEAKAPFCAEPVFVKHFKNIYVDKIVSGKHHIVAFTGEKIYSWGCNNEKQLFSNVGGVCLAQACDLHPQAGPIVDVEAYGNYTAVLLSENTIVKSGLSKSVLHVQSSSAPIKLCASSASIHCLSSLGVIYSFKLSSLNKNTHYKMSISKEKISDIFSGHYASAVDIDKNLWNLDIDNGLVKEINCVQSARLNEKFSLILSGAEKIPWKTNNNLSSLFEIAEERVIDSVVRLK